MASIVPVSCSLRFRVACFSFIRDWVENKVRQHLMRARKLRASVGRGGVGGGCIRGWACTISTGFSAFSPADSQTRSIGLISLLVKPTGKRSAGNPHAAFDEAGAGNGAHYGHRASSRPYLRGPWGETPRGYSPRLQKQLAASTPKGEQNRGFRRAQQLTEFPARIGFAPFLSETFPLQSLSQRRTGASGMPPWRMCISLLCWDAEDSDQRCRSRHGHENQCSALSLAFWRYSGYNPYP